MNGKKTYIVAVLMILHALSAYALGHEPSLNLQEILAALGLSALRAGVKKVEPDDSSSWGNPSAFILGALCSLCVHSASAADLGRSSGLTAREDARPTGQLTTRDSKPGTHHAEPESYSKTSGFYLDSYVAARTRHFDEATYGYGLGVGYQLSPYWSTDFRAGHQGFDANGSAVQDLSGRLIARAPFDYVAPYGFLGASFDLERDCWHIQPGAGIELGANKWLRGLSLFAEGALDADLRGHHGYVFNGGVRLRF